MNVLMQVLTTIGFCGLTAFLMKIGFIWDWEERARYVGFTEGYEEALRDNYMETNPGDAVIVHPLDEVLDRAGIVIPEHSGPSVEVPNG